MTGTDLTSGARAEVVGRPITGVSFFEGFIEVHLEDVTLTGMTKPFGLVMCGPVRPDSLVTLIGSVVEDLVVVPGRFVAIDSGESRVAFPIGGETASGPESVRLFKPAQLELGLPPAHWIW